LRLQISNGGLGGARARGDAAAKFAIAGDESVTGEIDGGVWIRIGGEHFTGLGRSGRRWRRLVGGRGRGRRGLFWLLLGRRRLGRRWWWRWRRRIDVDLHLQVVLHVLRDQHREAFDVE
jgi:hypothetical protein